MKQKVAFIIFSILFSVKKPNTVTINLGSAEIVIIAMNSMFFLVLIGGIVLVFLKINNKK